MLWLKRVIARLLMRQTPHLEVPVLPTQTVGLAHQEPTAQRGNKRSVQATKPKSPARQPSLKKPKAVSKTTAVKEGQSKKRKPAQTVKQQSTPGKSSRTPAHQTLQRAKSAPKRKP